MNTKKILLIGGNYHPEPTGIGKYNGEMIDWLAANNFECSVITTYPYYPQWKVEEKYTKRSFWFKKEKRAVKGSSLPVKIIRCPHFVPKSPSGLTRMISDFSFFFSAYLVVLPLLLTKRYDYVITVAPSFSVGLLGILYKYIGGARFLYHIQDLQIDAARDLNLIRSPFIIKVLFAVERYILSRADCISTISEGMIKKVQEKCKKEVILFPNWIDSELFYPLANKAELKHKFGSKPTEKIILYSGAIGHKQGLEAIIRSAKHFEQQPHLKFVICGVGPYKGNLERMKAEQGLQNVIFMPLQPSARFNSFLNVADVHLVLQKSDASDLVMPSKLGAILSIGGLAIVTAKEDTSLHNIMSAPDMGILIEPENQEALNDAILLATTFDHTEIKENTRRYAEENLGIQMILSGYAGTALNVQHDKEVHNKVLQAKPVMVPDRQLQP